MTKGAEPNLHEPDWDTEWPDAPVRSRVMRAGHRAGARELGAWLDELEAGGAVSPYPVHHGNEELLIVLTGRPAVRTPTGRRRVHPGAVVALPPGGAAGTHRVLIVSTVRLPETAECPDTGTVLAMTGSAAGRAFPVGGGGALHAASRRGHAGGRRAGGPGRGSRR